MPFIQPGSDVHIKPVPFSRLNEGDIVTFQKEDTLISHRILYKSKRYIVTKGDNKPQSDGKIYPKQIVGKVTSIQSNGRTIDINQYNSSQANGALREASQIQTIFERSGIDLVFLEGTPVYARFQNRNVMTTDSACDILIKNKDFKSAEALLIASGYKKITGTVVTLSQSYSKEVNNHSIRIVLRFEPSFLTIGKSKFEALYPKQSVTNLAEELLREKREITVKSHSFYVLSDFHLILYIALHIFQNNFHDARRYRLLDLLIKDTFRHKQKNTEVQLKNVIIKYRLYGFLSPVFFLLKKYYQTPIPQEVMRQFTSSHRSIFGINIFDDEPYLRTQINHFRWIFALSPNRKSKWIVFFSREFWKRALLIVRKKAIRELHF